MSWYCLLEVYWFFIFLGATLISGRLFLMKARFFRARARNRTRNRFVFYLLCLIKTITMEYNPAFDAGMSSTKQIFA